MMKIRNLLIFLLVGLALTGCSGPSIKKIDVVKKIDFEEVQWYALRAAAAYKSEKDIRQAFPQTVRVATVSDTKIQYFIEVFPESRLQLISVRGTANLKNGLEDAEYFQSKNGKLGIYVYRGFDAVTTKIYEDVLPHLKTDYAVKTTGHSLGAAVSTLLMMYMHQDGYRIEKSINFGQPKVTNKAGVSAYGYLPLTRVVDENDVVPLVPPVTLLDSLHGIYEHLGDELILLKGKDYVYLDKHDAARKSVGDFWKNLGRQSIKEHFMANYLKNIKGKLKTAIQVPYGTRAEKIP
jgi:triacylglycerol lipase